MSVVGFDVGNESCIVAVARQRGIDVVLNDESKRETPAIVCFGEKQRFIGTAGAASSTMNPKNSVSQIKRLLGRKFSDPAVQRDIQSFPFKVTEGPDESLLIHANYLGELRTFTPTQVLAMILSNLKSIAEKNLNAAVVDCCIGIPVYFNDLQRRAMLDASTIAGLHPLRLFHETTATALAYGIYKTDLPENDQINVAFVDAGHASMQVCIASYKKGQLKILAHSYDQSLGGRDFDEAIFKYFAAKFKDEYKIDVYQNARACIRLRAACEKLKKVLGANPEAPMNIECLMDEKDVRGFMKREEFEQISLPILERVKGPLEKALAEARLGQENIHSVEVVGSGSRIPAIIKILTDFFGKEPRRTMNASECVARGCALECAILSPTFKVREFQVHDSFPFSIALLWKETATDSGSGGTENQHSTAVFPKGNPIPSVKSLTFFRSGTFSVDVVYADAGDSQIPAKISTVTIGPFQLSARERAKVKAKVRLNLHGIVSIDSATVEYSKKKAKKTNIPAVETVYGALSSDELQKAIKKEFEMALQDRVMEETKDRKNAVEAYVYDMRNKLHDKYEAFVTTSEKDELIAKLQEVEDWLYEDGEDETMGVYVAKLEELRKQGTPIEERYSEWTERTPAIDQLDYCINSFRAAALSNDSKLDHIELAEKQKVVSECCEAEAWLREKQQQQDALPKYANPVLLSGDIKRKTEALDEFCKPIMTKPQPASPKGQTPGDQSQASELQNQGEDGPVESMAHEGSQVSPATDAEPMDTD
ncbi:heat shock 70 kDa protein 14-like [Zingiber officinale]|uniref:heat shock 70 kDa protein 14-like n=1 Tax=Zingiber officinale TaxID=94328 RepID=UPI001C4AFDAC|nr:heat shock 70 kDa protein 14-like [Zingiber officinale]